MKKYTYISMLTFVSLLASGVAKAAVDIEGKEPIDVSDWSNLKTEAGKSANSDKVVVLKNNIVAEANDPIETIADNLIIDGGGHTISGNEGGGGFLQHIPEDEEQKNLVIQNVTFSGFKGSNKGFSIGAIANIGYIKDITADFIGNSTSGVANMPDMNSMSPLSAASNAILFSAAGSAIYNEGTIENITGVFRGNFVQSTSNVSSESLMLKSTMPDLYNSAQGGAIYNGGTMTLVNSSFYDNYVQTDALKDSFSGMLNQGGAIYNAGNLTIRADAGTSEFSGNKTIWADGEDSSAIYLGMSKMRGSSLTLDSVNGGLIKFDDKISAQNEIDEMLTQYKVIGLNITDDGEGGYIISDPYDGETIYAIKKTGDGFKISDFYNFPADELEDELAYYRDAGYDIKQEGDNYIITKDDEYIEIIKQEDGTYTESANMLISKYGGNITITGDESSRVEFNNALENIGTIDISGTNVDVNEGVGTIYRTVTHDGGVLNINAGANAEDSIINDKGTLNVANTAKIYRTGINNGGVLNVAAGGYAQDTTVNSGGKLSAEAEARLNNMLANGGAILDIDSGAVLSGNIIIHADAEMGGTYDYSKIFKDEVLGDGSLTLVGGLNEALNESSLINTTEGKRLNLTSGDYVVGDNAYAVNGWDMLTLKDTANVKLEGDITLTGPNKKLIIENGSNLNLAGNSPSNYTITGSVSNAGMMDFTHPDDEADDITTIYGNYTAYNKAQMTIDVNPITNTSDLLRIDGDVAGTTDVVLNVLDYNTKPTELIKFVEATNDDLSTGAYFNIFRVDGSAFKWNSLYKDGAWYTATDDIITDDKHTGYGDGDKGNLEDDENLEDDAVLPPNFPDVPSGGGDSGKGPSVVGEAIAYMGLPSAGIEQTRDMTRNITNKVASTKVYSQQCHGFYDCEYDGKALRNVWAAPVYSYSDVKAPYSYEAEISGFEGGFDIQSDVYNRLGVFASYRQGSYDFDGDGDDYYSKTGADMDIDSYILGLYHRYDEGKLWTMGQVFLGYQDVSMSSDDGVSSSTDGIEFGAAVEGGLIFNPMTNLTIEPIIRLAYTQINYDDATDNYGKTAKYGDVRNIEVEAGVKVEKTYLRKNGYAKLYVKPSIIQNIGSGDVQVTSLRKVDGLENSTLGRIEVGGSMSFDEQWSGYANAAYTFGSDYTNLGLNAGLNYAF